MGDRLARTAALLAASIALGATPKTEVERLEDLIAEASQANPDIRMAARLYQAAKQKPSRDGALPDRRVSIGFQTVGGVFPRGRLGAEPMAHSDAAASAALGLAWEDQGKHMSRRFPWSAPYVSLPSWVRGTVTNFSHPLVPNTGACRP